MNWCDKKLTLPSFALAASAMVGACGGGDPAPAGPDAATVFKVVRSAVGGAEPFLNGVTLAVNKGINVRTVRCGAMSPPPGPPGSVGIGDPDPVIVLGISVADVDKAIALGFVAAGPAELARVGFFPC